MTDRQSLTNTGRIRSTGHGNKRLALEVLAAVLSIPMIGAMERFWEPGELASHNSISDADIGSHHSEVAPIDNLKDYDASVLSYRSPEQFLEHPKPHTPENPSGESSFVVAQASLASSPSRSGMIQAYGTVDRILEEIYGYQSDPHFQATTHDQPPLLENRSPQLDFNRLDDGQSDLAPQWYPYQSLDMVGSKQLLAKLAQAPPDNGLSSFAPGPAPTSLASDGQGLNPTQKSAHQVQVQGDSGQPGRPVKGTGEAHKDSRGLPQKLAGLRSADVRDFPLEDGAKKRNIVGPGEMRPLKSRFRPGSSAASPLSTARRLLVEKSLAQHGSGSTRQDTTHLGRSLPSFENIRTKSRDTLMMPPPSPRPQATWTRVETSQTRSEKEEGFAGLAQRFKQSQHKGKAISASPPLQHAQIPEDRPQKLSDPQAPFFTLSLFRQITQYYHINGDPQEMVVKDLLKIMGDSPEINIDDPILLRLGDVSSFFEQNMDVIAYKIIAKMDKEEEKDLDPLAQSTKKLLEASRKLFLFKGWLGIHNMPLLDVKLQANFVRALSKLNVPLLIEATKITGLDHLMSLRSVFAMYAKTINHIIPTEGFFHPQKIQAEQAVALSFFDKFWTSIDHIPNAKNIKYAANNYIFSPDLRVHKHARNIFNQIYQDHLGDSYDSKKYDLLWSLLVIWLHEHRRDVYDSIARIRPESELPRSFRIFFDNVVHHGLSKFWIMMSNS